MREAGLATLVIIEGMDGSGWAEITNWLWTCTAFRLPSGPSDKERKRPYFERFWRTLPGAGEMAIFLGGWYRDILIDGVRKKLAPDMLASDPVLHTYR